MGGDFHPIGIESFKHHNGGSRQGAGVQSIGQFHGASAFFRDELHLGGDFRPVYQERLPSGLVHQYARNGVGFARGQASVLHHVHDGDFPGGVGSVLAVHGGGGAQGGLFRLGDLHGLCFVVNIRMGGDFHTVRVESFKHHDGGSRQGAGVQRIG